MTDPLTRLDEVDARVAAATEGPWELCRAHPVSLVEAVPTGDDVGEIATESDAEFIAHARQDIPTLSKALRAVLELHRRVPVYEIADSCGHKGDEHEIGNDSWGDELCLDSPTGGSACDYCTEIDSEIEYPCPTVQAIQAALAVSDEGGTT